MKITKSRLKQIITEELQNILSEVDPTKVLDPVEMAKKRQADREARASERLKRARLEGRARRLMKLLYPLTYRDEMVSTIKQNNDEGNFADDLFGFLFPEVSGARTNSLLMDVVEEWIETRSGEEETALEIAGRSKPENLESLLSYRDRRLPKLGRAEFDKAVAYGDKSPARNVPVPKSATPGTPAYDALDAIMRDLGTQLKRR